MQQLQCVLDHLYISALMLIKMLFFLHELFPFFMGKRVQFHASFNENNIFFPQSVHDFNVVTGAIVVLIVW